MFDPAHDIADRSLFGVIAGVALVGAISLGIGVWGLASPPPEWMPFQVGIAPVGEVVAGVLFLGFAAKELHRRMRLGPQQPGRHSTQ